MRYSNYRFIDPRILAAIDRLPLLAKTVVDGFMLGMHYSRHVGAGLEFNQYRGYEPGDDLRRVDWKLYARSDRYYVRESEVETSIAIRFVLDATASMLHEEDSLSKFDYARFLVASLGYLAHMQGDAIGLHFIKNEAIRDLPPRHFAQYLHRFFHELEEIEASGIWPDMEELSTVFGAGSRRSMVVFVSDMHEADNEIVEALSTLRTLKHEVVLFHLLGHQERDFAYRGRITFEDLETGRSLPCDADAIRPIYLAAQQRALDTLRQTLHDRNIAYEPLTLDQPLDFALQHFLVRRAGVRG